MRGSPRADAGAAGLIVAAQRHKAVLQPFFAELNEALTGTGPTAAISLEDLASMPQLEAFTKEVAAGKESRRQLHRSHSVKKT